jgi:succinoglycan biosynthesis protein ExoA
MKEEYKPKVSVIVPCYNEKQHAKEFLTNLAEQIEGTKDCEIIVADGMSDDGTREIIQKIIKSNKHIRLIDNKNTSASYGLNSAIKVSKGEIIIRMDMHTIYASDYIEKCVETLQNTNADNVGGAARIKAVGYIQRANGIAFATKFSVGGAKFHQEDYEGFVDTVPYGCWWKHTLIEIGLFDENLIRNQDDELNYRIIKRGGKIWQSSNIKSWYYPRSTLQGIFLQYLQYGYWKVKILKKHKTLSSWRQLMPMLLVSSILYFGVMGAFSEWNLKVLYSILFLYAITNIIFSIISCNLKRDRKYIAALPIVYMMYHFGYGIGYIIGLLTIFFPRAVPSNYLTKTSR